MNKTECPICGDGTKWVNHICAECHDHFVRIVSFVLKGGSFIFPPVTKIQSKRYAADQHRLEQWRRALMYPWGYGLVRCKDPESDKGKMTVSVHALANMGMLADDLEYIIEEASQ